MTEYQRPLPTPDRDSEFFWESARRQELVLQQCADCQKFRFYPRSVCPHCLSDRFEWRRASGHGVVYSFTVIHRPPTPAFREQVPYVLALIDLAEGVRMMSNIVGCDPQEVAMGMPVEVTFEELTAEITLPVFKPTTGWLKGQKERGR
jgi:uncharacterized OB-fold protein